jgi:hypothetical protein
MRLKRISKQYEATVGMQWPETGRNERGLLEAKVHNGL